MRKIRIWMLVLMCVVTVFLCGIFAYGMAGYDIYKGFHRVYNNGYANMKLVLEKEVSLDKIDSISISYNMNSNDIYLHEGTDSTLTIKEYYSGKLNDNEVSTVKVNGSSLVIEGKRRNNFGISYSGGYTEIWLPAGYNGELQMKAASGDINSDMDIVLEKDFSAETSSGDITMPDISAMNVSIACSSGYVKVKNITGNANISTSSGDIAAQCIDGSADIKASSGYVKVLNGDGERTISTSSGDICLEGVVKPWNIKTTSGYVSIKAQKGNGKIGTTSGDIAIELEELTGSMEISSSSGYVNLKLSEDNAFDFEADTTSGDINTFFDDNLSFSKKGNSVHGSYGNDTNGNKIQIGTTSGDVQITKH